jgi:hypothetical protein
MKFKLLESFLFGDKVAADFASGFGRGGRDYYEFYINSELDEDARVIIDLEGNVYSCIRYSVDGKPLPSLRVRIIHCEMVKAIEKNNAFKAPPKLMAYFEMGNKFLIDDDERNDVENAEEFRLIKKRLKRNYPSYPLYPEKYRKWMRR